MKSIFSQGYNPDELDAFLDDLNESINIAENLFRDAYRCRFIPVMVAEQLSVRETGSLLDELERLQISAKEIVVNQLSPIDNCPVCAQAHGQQVKELGHLPKKFSGHSFWGLPMLGQELKGTKLLQELWEKASPLNISAIEQSGSFEVVKSSEPTNLLQTRVANPAPHPPSTSSLLLFAGKGGVGKTTLACAAAVRLAREKIGREVLLFSADPAHSIADCLDKPVGPIPIRIFDGLTAFEINAANEFQSLKEQYRRELDEFLQSILKSFDLTFDREVMERIFDLSPPGLDEIMALTSVMDFLAEKRFDILVLDSAPTGHLIRLLELPEIIDQWLKAFFELFLKYKNIFRLPGIAERLVKMSKDLNRFRALLKNSQQSALYTVSILTRMALEETVDLLTKCKNLEVSVPAIFLNMATPESSCPFCTSRVKHETRIMHEYKRIFPGQHETVVYRQEEPRGIDKLEILGNALYEPLEMERIHA